MKYFLIGLLVLVGLPMAAMLTFRIYKDVAKKRGFANTYAIQNVGTGKDIRVRDAGIADCTKIILYSHHEWECMTWRFIQVDEGVFLLQNLYTQKSLQPSSQPEAGVDLWQQSLGGSPLQYWEFLKQPDETYQIRLKGTELYVTAPSAEDNSAIVLAPKNDAASQRWRLVRQTPVV
ncbi:MAG: RICIN domain-containing protein [Phycisphaerae bacterium]|jgi:hypothetical protein